MQNSMLKFFFIGMGILIFGFYTCTFIVDKTQYAIAIQLGKPSAAEMEPGLKFMIPFVTRVFYVDNRLLPYDSNIFVKADTIAVVIAPPADGPSFGTAPSGTCTWTSIFW